MASYENVPVGRLRGVTLKGLDVVPYCHKVACRESICSSYLTARITIVDRNNIIQGLELKGAEPATIAIDGPPNSFVYQQNYMILAIEEHEAGPDNLKAKL